MELIGKALIAQGGGPTAVINQSMAGIIAEARKHKQISKIYGALRGVEGIVNEDFIDLTQETAFNLDQVAQTPSSALLSTRVKPDANYCKEIFKVLKAHDIRYFFYIGGNDSSDTVHIVSEEAKLDNYEFRAIHVPKTIDNDLVVNDHTPGFSSAARFVSQAFAGINLDMNALSGVYMGIIMGRNAGFLTAAAAGAQKFPEDGPHLIYLPERPFIMKNFIADVKKVYDQYGVCVVAVSEGIKDASGTPIILSLLKDVEKDAHGNITMSGTGALGDLLTDAVKKGLGISRVRSDTFGYIQRCFLGCVSDVDQQEAWEVGEKAVQFALSANCNGSVTIHRVGDYAVEYRMTPLAEVAGKTKYMPDEFINAEGNHITDAFKNYLRPLLGSNRPPVARLRAPKIPKILNK
ncbi:6-phosphofructokinase [Pelosinus sp. sgz500959]|uniref:6-phosphofructokinase n=1 Tax=Pelosinus sp. sgz500959 TaxID=3242472 RepID=UPI00366B54DA